MDNLTRNWLISDERKWGKDSRKLKAFRIKLKALRRLSEVGGVK